MCLNLNPKRIFTFKHIIIFICLLLLLIGFVQVYRSCSRLLRSGSLSSLLPSPSTARGEGKGEKPLPVKSTTKLFGKEKTHLDISIPPHPKKIDLKVTENLQVYPAKAKDSLEIRNSKLEIKRSYTLIRFHPTLQLCVLFPLTTNIQQLTTIPGLKLRFLEIWRFGTAAYLTTKGPGLGIDFALISNLSLDYVRLLNSYALGLSLKL
jgi:hypothetical protein